MAAGHPPNLCCLLKRALISNIPVGKRRNIIGLCVRENWRVGSMAKGGRLEAAIPEALIAKKQESIVIGKQGC